MSDVRSDEESPNRCCRPEELKRLEDLGSAQIMDTAPESEFDDLLRLAAHLCVTKKAAITFVGEHYVFHKSSFGFQGSDVPRSASICDHTIRQDEVFVVEDLSEDRRFMSNGVIRSAGIRFYAGAPLLSPAGARLGAICLLDDTPRELSKMERVNLQVIARQVSLLIALRIEREKAEVLNRDLAFQQQLLAAFVDNTPVASCLKEKDGRIISYNKAFAKRFAITKEAWVGKTSYDLWPRSVADEIAVEELEAQATGVPQTRYNVVPEGQKETHWRTTRIFCKTSAGHEMMICIYVDVTDEAQQRLRSEEKTKRQGDIISRLQALLQNDELTGLMNRRAFEKECLSAVSALKSNGSAFGVVNIEIGALMERNRAQGTHEVDGLLRRIGLVLQEGRSDRESAARVTGGSFRIVLRDATASELTRLRARVEEKIREIRWNGPAVRPRIRENFFEDRGMRIEDVHSTPSRLTISKPLPQARSFPEFVDLYFRSARETSIAGHHHDS